MSLNTNSFGARLTRTSGSLSGSWHYGAWMRINSYASGGTTYQGLIAVQGNSGSASAYFLIDTSGSAIVRVTYDVTNDLLLGTLVSGAPSDWVYCDISHSGTTLYLRWILEGSSTVNTFTLTGWGDPTIEEFYVWTTPDGSSHAGDVDADRIRVEASFPSDAELLVQARLYDPSPGAYIYLPFDAVSGFGDDQSGNGRDFTETGTPAPRVAVFAGARSRKHVAAPGTFSFPAPLPGPPPMKLLVAASDGSIIARRPDSHQFGSREGLPGFVVLTVPEAVAADLDELEELNLTPAESEAVAQKAKGRGAPARRQSRVIKSVDLAALPPPVRAQLDATGEAALSIGNVRGALKIKPKPARQKLTADRQNGSG